MLAQTLKESKPIQILPKAHIWQEVSPFKDKTAQALHEMFLKKGFRPTGRDPMQGYGSYVNPKNNRQYHIDPKNKLVQYRGPKEDRFAIGRYNHIYAGFELFSNHSHFDKPAIMESFQKQYLLKGMLSLEEFHNVSRYVSASTRLKINNNFVKICEKNIPKDGYVHFSENKLHLIKASGGHYDSMNSVALLISTKI